MELLTTVEYNETTIRVYGEKHNPQFYGADVVSALGYEDAPAMLRQLAPYEKQFIPDGGLVVSEFGVASLASDAYFRQWFSTEVLPSLHRYGYYKPPKKKYERLYELADGEKLNREELSRRAISYGMQKTEAKRSSITAIVNFISDKEAKKAEKEFFEQQKAAFPYTYEELDELCSNNLSVLLRLLPEDTYIKYNGHTYFNEQAVSVIKAEMAKWK